eukprot:scaffold1930_cov346-Prasinococcus_capsulatus_cf.AAC.21
MPMNRNRYCRRSSCRCGCRTGCGAHRRYRAEAPRPPLMQQPGRLGRDPAPWPLPFPIAPRSSKFLRRARRCATVLPLMHRSMRRVAFLRHRRS